MPFPEPGGREHAAPGPDRLLADLTPEQAQAVTHSSGPLLLLAGPGAGKTKTLTHRAARLVLGGSETGDELDASFLEIAEERACRDRSVQRPASVPPTAGRTAEREVVDRPRRSGVTATPTRCCSPRKGPSRETAGRRPLQQRGRGRPALAQSLPERRSTVRTQGPQKL